MNSNMENLLQQAVGRTGSSSGHPHDKGWHNSLSNGSGDSDPKPDKLRYSRRKIPLGSQMPLKKRHMLEIKGKSMKYSNEEMSGANSDSEPSIGSDLYKDEDDKARLEMMPELDREMILAERSNCQDDNRFKKMVRKERGNGQKRYTLTADEPLQFFVTFYNDEVESIYIEEPITTRPPQYDRPAGLYR